jgi:hypothetical protein
VVTDACAGPAAPSPTAFGFDYGVPGYIGDWYGTNWATCEAAFRRDAVVMAAFGARVVRVMLLPYFSGMRLVEGGGDAGDPAALRAAAAALPGIVGALRDHGISVVLALGPNALFWNGPEGDSRRWWEWAYGAGGWSRFVDDVATWAREIVEAVESSDACDGVLYWDLLNEADYRVAGMGELVRALFRRVPVPDAKRGMSVLYASDAARVAADAAAEGKTVAWADIHSYPDRAHNPDPAAALSALRSAFSAARVLAGEIGGIWCENGQDEDRQRDTVLGLIDGASSASAVAVLNWMLWDYAGGRTCDAGDSERIGFGWSADDPRDVLGAVTERRSRTPGGDFETDLSGWAWGGTGTDAELVRGGPSETDAATNLYYLRLTVTGAGAYWACAPAHDLSGTHAAVTGYVRSSAAQVRVDMHYRDALGWTWETGREALGLWLAVPPGWRFQHLQSLGGGFVFDLPPGTTQANLCFRIDTTSAGPTYLDLDAIGVAAY